MEFLKQEEIIVILFLKHRSFGKIPIRGGVACPFTAPLILKTESGRSLTIFLATDSCNAWLSDGVYYDYHGYENIDEIYELFQTKSTHMEKCILKINDTLYYGTDEIGPMGDSGSVSGHIESSVAENETPTKNGDSSYDYAEVHLKRAYTNYLSGWEIENIYLEK